MNKEEGLPVEALFIFQAKGYFFLQSPTGHFSQPNLP